MVAGWRNLSGKFDFVRRNQTKMTGASQEDLPLFTRENAVDLHSLGSLCHSNTFFPLVAIYNITGVTLYRPPRA
jgi:hypothetical protein